MPKLRKLSIQKLANIIPAIIIMLVIINIVAVLFIGLIYHSINRYEEASGIFFRSFNTYALAISTGGDVPTPEITEIYSELSNIMNKINLREMTLAPPEYSDSAEKELYSAELRDYALSIRSHLSEIIDRSYLGIGLLFGLLIVAGIFLLVMMIVFRYSIKKYQSELSYGLGSLKKIIQFESRSEFTRIESNIKEIDELNDALINLSNDVSYNFDLIERSTLGTLDLVMNDIYKSFCEVMPCDRIALAFIDSYERCIAETAVTSYKNPCLRPGYRESLSSTSLPRLISSGKPRIINNLEQYSQSREVSVSTGLLLKEGIKSSMTLPMMFDGKCLGFFFVSSLEENAYNKSTLSYAMRVINLLKQKLYIEFILQEVISETANAFVGLMEEKDNETSAHIMRMSQYAYITARSYHETVSPLPPRFMREILWYAPMHDIGKVGTPDAILLKEGPLTADEMTVMKGHVDIGIRVIEKMNERLHNIFSTHLLDTAVEIIAGHHEKFNGRGYPLGLKGEDIPLAGRIVAIADVFDALTSKRPYKNAYSIEKALEIIENEMADSFDPQVISAFKYGLPEVREVYDRLKEV